MIVRTNGDKAEFGSITATQEEYFYPWRDIWPEKYRDYTPPLGVERRQELLVQGIFPKETLLDIVRTCTVFMDVGKTRAKIVARYQQYRAVNKIVERLRTGQTPTDRSGVIWHTQGLRQVAHHGLPDPQAADVRGPEGLQGLPDQ